MPDLEWQIRLSEEIDERRFDDIWHAFDSRQISRVQRDVLIALRTYQPAEGAPATPTHDDLAGCVDCDARTVSRALTAARRLGLVS